MGDSVGRVVGAGVALDGAGVLGWLVGSRGAGAVVGLGVSRMGAAVIVTLVGAIVGTVGVLVRTSSNRVGIRVGLRVGRSQMVSFSEEIDDPSAKVALVLSAISQMANPVMIANSKIAMTITTMYKSRYETFVRLEALPLPKLGLSPPPAPLGLSLRVASSDLLFRTVFL